MNELTEKLRQDFKDEETRHIYAEDFLNTYIATQIKVLREERGWTQSELASKAGMKQERISVLEDVNHSSWTASVLKRIARAFDMRLSIKIESFGSFLNEFENFNRDALVRPPFEEDPAFKEGDLQTEEPTPDIQEIFAVLQPVQQRAGVVFIEEFLASKAQSATMRGGSPYETLVRSSGQSRLSIAS